jgi:hypothetical protein
LPNNGGLLQTLGARDLPEMLSLSGLQVDAQRLPPGAPEHRFVDLFQVVRKIGDVVAVPKTQPVLQRNQYWAALSFLLFFPSVVPPLFFPSHRSGCDRKALTMGKLNDNAKKIPPGSGLPKHVIDGIYSR